MSRSSQKYVSLGNRSGEARRLTDPQSTPLCALGHLRLTVHFDVGGCPPTVADSCSPKITV